MNFNKKISLVLVVAMVMTIAMVVLVYADEMAHKPAWNEGTGRYTQVYEMYTSPNWKYTSNLDENGYIVQKKYSSRDGLVQCTSNGLTAFPTYYRIYMGGSDIIALSNENTLTGVGTTEIGFPSSISAGTYTCLGIRNDPRYNTTVTNKGNWSPDTY